MQAIRMQATEIAEIKYEQVEFKMLKEELLKGGGRDKESSQEFNIQTIVRNLSRSTVYLSEMYIWKGDFVTGEHEIPVKSQARTLQKGSLPEGVKFGLVYVDGFGTTARKFVIAVDSPTGKVYAEAGPTGPVNWDIVEARLDAGGKRAEYKDPRLGGKVVVEMVGVNATATFYN